MIGDAGFAAATGHRHVTDLGEEWRRVTGLPFVYAIWAGRAGRARPADVALLQQSLADGLAHRREIARAWAEAHGGPPALYEKYLTQNIRYRLGAEELSGVAAFFAKMREAGPLARAVRMRFFDGASATATAIPPLTAPPARRAPGQHAWRRSLDALLADAAGGARLTPDDAMRLYEQAPALDLGAAADARRQALHPEGIVTYIIDRNVNYTNVCVTRCKFCNFYRPPGSKEGYTLSREVLAQKLQETVDLGGVQILLQGGLNPELPIT